MKYTQLIDLDVQRKLLLMDKDFNTNVIALLSELYSAFFTHIRNLEYLMRWYRESISHRIDSLEDFELQKDEEA